MFEKRALPDNLQVSVIVPVRNEAPHLTATLDALRKQVDVFDKPLNEGTYEVLVLANNCTDNSADVVSNYRKSFPQFPLFIEEVELPVARANIGVVRRMLMDAAYNRLNQSGNPNGIIASTDGDTIVDSKWICNIINEIGKGNDAVGGRILTKATGSPNRLYHLRSVMYRSLLTKAEAVIDPCVNDPWPCHFQYYGASLAVTCNTYERAGRLPQVPYLEDNAFLEALNSIDAKVRKSNQVIVYTSTRMQGRVEIGFSEQLKVWNNLAATSSVQSAEPAETSILRLKNRHSLRNCQNSYRQNGHCEADLSAIAHSLGINYGWLKNQLEKSTYFGALWQKVEQELKSGAWSKKWNTVPITEAIQKLRLFLSTHN